MSRFVDLPHELFFSIISFVGDDDSLLKDLCRIDPSLLVYMKKNPHCCEEILFSYESLPEAPLYHVKRLSVNRRIERKMMLMRTQIQRFADRIMYKEIDFSFFPNLEYLEIDNIIVVSSTNDLKNLKNLRILILKNSTGGNLKTGFLPKHEFKKIELLLFAKNESNEYRNLYEESRKAIGSINFESYRDLENLSYFSFNSPTILLNTSVFDHLPKSVKKLDAFGTSILKFGTSMVYWNDGMIKYMNDRLSFLNGLESLKVDRDIIDPQKIPSVKVLRCGCLTTFQNITKAIPHLESLECTYRTYSKNSLKSMKDLQHYRNLKHFRIQESDLPPPNFFSGFACLESLSLSIGFKPVDGGILIINDIPTLRKLDLTINRRNTMLKSLELKGLPKLQELNLNLLEYVQFAGIHPFLNFNFQTLKNLKYICFSGSCKRKCSQIESMISKFPSLKHLKMSNVNFLSTGNGCVDSTIRVFSESLEIIEMTSINHINGARNISLDIITPNLRVFSIVHVEQLEHLNLECEMPQLKEFKFRECPFEEGGRISFGKMPNLEVLELSGGGKFEGLEMMENLKLLRWLYMDDIKSLRRLNVSRFPNLNHLEISRCRRSAIIGFEEQQQSTTTTKLKNIIVGWVNHLDTSVISNSHHLKFLLLTNINLTDPDVFQKTNKIEKIKLTISEVDVDIFYHFRKSLKMLYFGRGNTIVKKESSSVTFQFERLEKLVLRSESSDMSDKNLNGVEHLNDLLSRKTVRSLTTDMKLDFFENLSNLETLIIWSSDREDGYLEKNRKYFGNVKAIDFQYCRKFTVGVLDFFPSLEFFNFQCCSKVNQNEAIQYLMKKEKNEELEEVEKKVEEEEEGEEEVEEENVMEEKSAQRNKKEESCENEEVSKDDKKDVFHEQKIMERGVEKKKEEQDDEGVKKEENVSRDQHERRGGEEEDDEEQEKETMETKDGEERGGSKNLDEKQETGKEGVVKKDQEENNERGEISLSIDNLFDEKHEKPKKCVIL